MLDPVKVERAEGEIDRFITSRSKQREEANAVEALWKASERAHAAKQREENRTSWIIYYTHLAQGCRQRAEEYDEKVEALLTDEPRGEA